MLNRSDLHAYQIKAVKFIREQRKCGLFLDMGLGKTAIALTAVSDMLDAFIVKKVLVIGPLRVCNSVWAQEAASWNHLRHLNISVCVGTAAQRKTALGSKADVYVINRENVMWLVDECKKKRSWPFDAVVIDESSSFKNHSSKRFRKLKSVLKFINVMVLLTGTPSPNGLLDLWSQMYLIDQGEALGKTITGYRQRFFYPDYWGYNWTPKEGSDKKIQALIQPRIMSMAAEDYLELPERIDLIEKVFLPEAVFDQYKEFEHDLIIKLSDGKEIEAQSVAVLANKLLQWANGACYTDDTGAWTEIHNEKLNTLAEIIEENPNENILVAYNYKTDLIRIRARFPDAVLLDKDPATIEKWNRGEIKLMLAHPASCGHGINLQRGGAMVIWFGLNWSLELDQQMNARLLRQGQSRPVRIIRIVAANTIDERVLMILENKDHVQHDLLQALKRDFSRLI